MCFRNKMTLTLYFSEIFQKFFFFLFKEKTVKYKIKDLLAISQLLFFLLLIQSLHFNSNMSLTFKMMPWTVNGIFIGNGQQRRNLLYWWNSKFESRLFATHKLSLKSKFFVSLIQNKRFWLEDELKRIEANEKVL